MFILKQRWSEYDSEKKMFRNICVFAAALAVFVFQSEILLLEITRPQRKEDRDLFTNVGAIGRCRNRNGRSLCLKKDADCAQGDKCCTCKCKYEDATFYVYSKDRLHFTCEKNTKIRELAGCAGFGFYQITPSQPPFVVDLNKTGSQGVMKSTTNLPVRLKSFGVKESATFQDWGKWKEVRRSSQPVFSMVKIKDYPYYELQWTDFLGSSYNGRLMRVNVTWTEYDSSTKYGCVVFRVAGNLSYNLGQPSPPPSGTITSVVETTALSVAHTATIKEKTSSIKKEKTPVMTTAMGKTTSSWEKTTFTTTTPSEQSSSAKIEGASSRKGPEYISSRVLATSSAPPTERGPTTSTESNREESKGGIVRGNVIIAIISAAAAVICVLIISLFAWLIVRQRKRNRRNDGSYNARVISNPTAAIQNNIPLPVIKNPMYDENEPVYSEAFDKHQRSLPKLPRHNRFANPTYSSTKGNSSIIIKNTGANAKEPGLIPYLRSSQKNIYVEKDLYDNRECAPLYEGIANQNSGDYDNQPLYQSLNSAAPQPRSSLYQPLQRKPAQSSAGPADYLQSADVIPEYLAIVNPAAESISGAKEQSSKASNPSQEAATPLYDVLEEPGPGNKASSDTTQANDEPDYDVLEDPEPSSSPSSIRNRAQQGLSQHSPSSGNSFRI